MSQPADKRGRQERILAELAELGLTLARDLQARALAAEDVSAASQLALTFHSVARTVRQTLALEAKLERDHQQAERAEREDAERDRSARADRRKAQVRAAVQRCVWSEADPDEAEDLLETFDDNLEDYARTGAFAGDDPLETHVARLCADLGVKLPEGLALEPLAEPPSAPAPALATLGPEPPGDGSAAWRSSA